jgi:hypothetical protein
MSAGDDEENVCLNVRSSCFCVFSPVQEWTLCQTGRSWWLFLVLQRCSLICCDSATGSYLLWIVQRIVAIGMVTRKLWGAWHTHSFYQENRLTLSYRHPSWVYTSSCLHRWDHVLGHYSAQFLWLALLMYGIHSRLVRSRFTATCWSIVQ